MQSQHLRHIPDRPEGLRRLLLLGGDRQGQTVDEHILLGDPELQGGGQDALRDLHPGLPGLGDALVVHAEPHHSRAILFAQGENGLQGLPVAVHGIDDGLAAVCPEPGLNGGGIGGVDLQGQLHHRLQGLHGPCHHVGLVDAGETHVHVQDLRPGLLLLHALLEDIVQIIFPEGLLEPLFPGGVDPFADDPDAAEFRDAGGGADAPLFRRWPGNGVFQHPGKGRDKVRPGAAAAAEDGDPQRQRRNHGLGEFRRGDGVFAGGRVRKPRVGLQNDGEGGPFSQLLHHGKQLLGTQGAVEAQGVHPETLQGQGHGGDCHPHEGPARGLKGHGDPDGKIGVLSGGQDGGLHLVQVAHGLKDHQVRAGLLPGHYHLPKNVIGLIEGQAAQGLQQLADGAHIQGHLHRTVSGGGSGGADPPGDQLPRGVAAFFHLETVRPEGVGVEDIASGLHVLTLDGGDRLWMGQVPGLRQLPHGKPRCLEHGAHGTVQQDDSVMLFHRTCPPSDIRRLHIGYIRRSPAFFAAAGRKHPAGR